MTKAYLHVLMVIESGQLVYKDAMIASQSNTSMNTTNSEFYFTMLVSEANTYHEAQANLFKTISNLANVNKVFEFIFNIIQKRNIEMMGALKMAGFDISKI